MIQRSAPGLALLCLALVVAACGGGSFSGGESAPPAAAPPATGALTVRAVTRSGTPLPGVSVIVNSNQSGKQATTGADGTAHFTGVATGEFSVDVFGPGYHRSYRRVVIERGRTTEQTISVLRAAEATPVVLGLQAAPGSNGRTLTVDLDLALLGGDGQPIASLTAAEFQAGGSDCGVGPCIEDAAGAPLSSGGHFARVETEPFAWHAAPSTAAPQSAIALLAETSDRLVNFDPDWRRAAALKAFLASVTAPDSVTMAAYYHSGAPSSPGLLTEGDGAFTPDGARFNSFVDSLPTLSRSTAPALNPVHWALQQMLAWMAARPAGEGPGQRSLVLVSSDVSWPDGCGGSWACTIATRSAIADASRASGTPITAIGGSDFAALMAARTGGAYVGLQDATQYDLVLRNLRAIATRGLGFNRVRLTLTGTADGVFQPGHTVWSYASVRAGPDTLVYFPVAVPIP